jgi:hypothetical protein
MRWRTIRRKLLAPLHERNSRADQPLMKPGKETAKKRPALLDHSQHQGSGRLCEWARLPSKQEQSERMWGRSWKHFPNLTWTHPYKVKFHWNKEVSQYTWPLTHWTISYSAPEAAPKKLSFKIKSHSPVWVWKTMCIHRTVLSWEQSRKKLPSYESLAECESKM